LLRNLLAERRRDANAWVVRTAAKKEASGIYVGKKSHLSP
jgi:hypothetical protein